MIKLEEKASWLLELENNNLFSRGTSDFDIVFEYQDWILILGNIIQYLDLKPFFNAREQLRFAIKKVYEDRFRFRTISTILLISLFFIIWISVFVSVMWLLYPETLNYFEILEFGLLFYSILGVACLISFKQKNKKVSKLFDAIDNLGLEYFQFTDKDEEEFLSANIKEENSSSIIYDIVEEMRKNRIINLVN